ncbi:MAG: hypothetical protein LBM27_05750 [Lactobacillaceae bacterium]|nr:hypothetical protein [Lactobacillaceae bacterium]
MTKTVAKSVERLQWNTEHHFLHIKAQHDFIRQWAVQFELGYSDARLIQAYLETEKPELWDEFTNAYEDVYQYEYAFVAGGLEGFNSQFGDKIDDYDKAHTAFLNVLTKI